MKKGIKEGVWGILWDDSKLQRGFNDDDMDMDDGEEEDGEDEEEEQIRGKGKKIIGENGWRVLGWLLDVWEKDQEEHTLDHPDQRK